MVAIPQCDPFVDIACNHIRNRVLAGTLKTRLVLVDTVREAVVSDYYVSAVEGD